MDRSQNISRRNDNKHTKDIVIDLYKIDSILKQYFDNNIQPEVIGANNVGIQVPLKYASPEKWKSIQKDNYVRNSDGQIQTPIMIYKRTSVVNDDTMIINKMDADKPQLFHTFKTGYSKNNRYSNFDILVGQKPIQQIQKVVIPQYIVATYEFNIWTDYIEQMNTLQETIGYYNKLYWGDDNYKFRVSIDDFSLETEIATDSDRIVKSNFTLTLNGYIIPDIYAKHLPVTKELTYKKADNNSEWIEETE